MFAWATGIPTMIIPGVPPDEILAELDRQGITYLVVDHIDLEPHRTRLARQMVSLHPCRFEPTFHNVSFEIYRINVSCEEGTRS